MADPARPPLPVDITDRGQQLAGLRVINNTRQRGRPPHYLHEGEKLAGVI